MYTLSTRKSTVIACLFPIISLFTWNYYFSIVLFSCTAFNVWLYLKESQFTCVNRKERRTMEHKNKIVTIWWFDWCCLWLLCVAVVRPFNYLHLLFTFALASPVEPSGIFNADEIYAYTYWLDRTHTSIIIIYIINDMLAVCYSDDGGHTYIDHRKFINYTFSLSMTFISNRWIELGSFVIGRHIDEIEQENRRFLRFWKVFNFLESLFIAFVSTAWNIEQYWQQEQRK